MNRYDVIVVGAGTAGVFAALAAAEEGMKVLLLEKNSACGGIETCGMVVAYFDRNTLPLSIEIDRKVQEEQDKSGFVLPLRPNLSSAELLKIQIEQELLKSNVTLLYQAVVIAVDKQGERVTGIQWHDSSGNHQANASVVIDATAEGVVLAMAGASFLPDRLLDGTRQPYTRIYGYCCDGKFWNYGGDAGIVNQDNPEELTYELLKSAAGQILDQFTEEQKRFVYAPVIGVREGRHLLGRQTVRYADVMQGRQTEEPIAWEYANFDTHSIDMMFEEDVFFLYAVAAMQWNTRLNIAIPYEALLPQGLEGIIAAGRMLSVDHVVSQAVRMKGTMKQLGAVAGYAAAVAVREEILPSAVRAEQLKRFITLPDREQLLRENDALWTENEGEILDGLRNKMPGNAIWSAFLLGKTEYLYPLLEEDEWARVHAAFALALMKDRRSLPILRELVARRDESLSDTQRNEPIREPHGAIAAYLLGVLEDAESIPLLCQVFEEKHGFFLTAASWRALLCLVEKESPFKQDALRTLRHFVDGSDKIPLYRCYCGVNADATPRMKVMTMLVLKRVAR